MNNIRYVDDSTLLANNNEEQHLFDYVKEKSESAGLNMNINKTKTMVFSKIEGQLVNIITDDGPIEQVHQVKYLGQNVYDDVKSNKEIMSKIATAKSAFLSMKSILLSKDISIILRLQVIDIYIYPILSYGCK